MAKCSPPIWNKDHIRIHGAARRGRIGTQLFGFPHEGFLTPWACPYGTNGCGKLPLVISAWLLAICIKLSWGYARLDGGHPIASCPIWLSRPWNFHKWPPFPGPMADSLRNGVGLTFERIMCSRSSAAFWDSLSFLRVVRLTPLARRFYRTAQWLLKTFGHESRHRYANDQY